ncbi:unnamed protein product [Tilletia controversa]|uniref:FHA domain-containing protein n=1 Tax=Tilletia controversa TaxID=13291 RepID=A0A8X7MVB1_9BASI|nr:hypothetical protein CF328_g7765 [Tilletia controversa]KAE8248520.1 hypothetical protein A4X06_0g3652 [Tilletia controversa]CAD6958782.1 unnamed protein product [Tilletia controversa]CAD6976772.1 unnamed protein product [Tilletia controversa]
MLTFIKFAPLDPANHDFVFILHPHLKRRNAINDDLLQLPFVVDDEARVQLQGTTPTIRSSRVKFGIYVNHQLLGSTPFPLCDGDIVAFPQRRHNLKTAARFRVAMESLELSCGVDQELPALRGFAQELEAEEARGMSTCTSSHSSKASEPIGVGTAALRTFSYAALVASGSPPIPHSSAPTHGPSITPSASSPPTSSSPSSSLSESKPPPLSAAVSTTTSLPSTSTPAASPSSCSVTISPASNTSSAAARLPKLSSSVPGASPLTPLVPSSTSVLTSGLGLVSASSGLRSTITLDVVTPSDPATSLDTPTPPASMDFGARAPPAIRHTLPSRPIPIASPRLCSADRALATVATAWATARRWMHEDSARTVPHVRSHASPPSEHKVVPLPVATHMVPTVTYTGSDVDHTRSSASAYWPSPMASRFHHSSPSILAPLLAAQSTLLDLLRTFPWYRCGYIPARYADRPR